MKDNPASILNLNLKKCFNQMEKWKKKSIS